jgi:hypothetical protein
MSLTEIFFAIQFSSSDSSPFHNKPFISISLRITVCLCQIEIHNYSLLMWNIDTQLQFAYVKYRYTITVCLCEIQIHNYSLLTWNTDTQLQFAYVKYRYTITVSLCEIQIHDSCKTRNCVRMEQSRVATGRIGPSGLKNRVKISGSRHSAIDH